MFGVRVAEVAREDEHRESSLREDAPHVPPYSPEDLGHRFDPRAPEHHAAWSHYVDESDDRKHYVEQQATTYALTLAMIRGGSDSVAGHQQILKLLDAVDDPDVRHAMAEKFQRQTGESLQSYMEHASWFGKRDAREAKQLISPERDAAARELRAMPVEDRRKLQNHVTPIAGNVTKLLAKKDANADDNARQVADALRPLKPVEVEALRAAVREQTSRSIYEYIDRGLAGGNEDEAFSALQGDPVSAARAALVNAAGDVKRMREVLHSMKPEQVAELRDNGSSLISDWMFHSLPEGAEREEITKLVGGDRAGADAVRIGNLFEHPTDGLRHELTMTGAKLTEESERNLRDRKPENVLRELRGMSQDQLRAARLAWEKHRREPWEDMIEARGDLDFSTRLQLEALARGDKVEAKALEARQGMREHDQGEIEEGLASADPVERQRIAKNIQALDRRGRNARHQLDASYVDFVEGKPSSNLFEEAGRSALHDKRETEAAYDRIAADELLANGQVSTATQVFRAQEDGDVRREAEILDALPTNKARDAVSSDFAAKYHHEMLEAPKLENYAQRAALLAHFGDTRSIQDIEEHLAYDDRSLSEERIEHVRRFGVPAQRNKGLERQLEHQLALKAHSDALEEDEQRRDVWGGAVGSQATERVKEAALDHELTNSIDPWGFAPRALAPGVTDEHFHQIDRAVMEQQDSARDEKVKLAEHRANVFKTIAKLGALAAGPLGFALLDVGSELGAMDIKKSIGGEAIDLTEDAKQLGTTALADAFTVGAASKLAMAEKTGENARALSLAEKAATSDVREEVASGATSSAKRSLDEFLGTPATDDELARAKLAAQSEATLSLVDQASLIRSGQSRSERDMLLSIKNKEMPRYVARVGTASPYQTFANPAREFVFATEPADLRGLSPAQAMSKVGWPRAWIEDNIERETEVTILDTSVTARDARVEVGPVDWAGLHRSVLADDSFLRAAESRGLTRSDVDELLQCAANAPISEAISRAGQANAAKMETLMALLDKRYSVNSLYTGIGATMDESGQLGAREVMVRPGGTGFQLSPGNHVKVGLGKLTREDVEALFKTRSGDQP